MFHPSLAGFRAIRRTLGGLVAVVAASFVPMLTALPSSTDLSAPPAFPDPAHVANGCHVSTLAYLARFRAEFPAERGEPLIVTMDNLDGATRPHTLALLSWRGAWWARDEYFGVFPLGIATDATTSVARLKTRAALALEKAGRARRDVAGYRRAPVAPGSLPAETLRREAATALAIIPFPCTLYWVRVGGAAEIPLVFFRPAPDWVAVYDPHRGTSLGECAIRDDATVVRLVAKKLGYRAEQLRTEFPAPAGGTLARAE